MLQCVIQVRPAVKLTTGCASSLAHAVTQATGQLRSGDVSSFVWLQAEVARVQQVMQQRVEEALMEARAHQSGLRDAREKNVHFSARVVALNSRVTSLTKQVGGILLLHHR